MPSHTFRRTSYFYLQIWHRLSPHLGILVRAAVCWGIGLVVLLFDRPSQFDRRFDFRGRQRVDANVVLIQFTPNEWSELNGLKGRLLRPLKEMLVVGDNFFWKEDVWHTLLERILRNHPKAIVNTFFFDSQIFANKTDSVFCDDRVIWAANLDNFGRLLMPFFANNYGDNVGTVELPLDDDRVVRRFSSPLLQVPNIAHRTGEKIGTPFLRETLPSGESKLINFRGPQNTFPSFSLTQIFDNKFPEDYFAGKIVVLGVKDSGAHEMQTPVGEMSSSEIYANIFDNLETSRWIKPVPIAIVLAYLALLVGLAIVLLLRYPQIVSSSVLLVVALVILTFSLYLFDAFAIWLPVISPLSALFSTYMVFVSYQLTLKENMNWRLEQERRNFLQLETMKNNFLSLISHDLKTPIAKIQAICDRLMNEGVVSEGLKGIRKESMELYRYIQSILQISRVESNALKLRRDAVDLNVLIERVAELLRPLANEKQIQITLILEPLFTIEADASLIQEVTLNLVENAIKYSPTHSEIKIYSEEQKDLIKVTVVDQGPGVPNDEVEKIFQKFYRGKKQIHSSTGTGLGLYLVKYFIELHGGVVFMENIPDHSFSIGYTLPLENDSDHA